MRCLSLTVSIRVMLIVIVIMFVCAYLCLSLFAMVWYSFVFVYHRFLCLSFLVFCLHTLFVLSVFIGLYVASCWYKSFLQGAKPRGSEAAKVALVLLKKAPLGCASSRT